MQRSASAILPLLILLLFVSGCDFLGDVLEFGFWSGVIIFGLVVGIIWAITKVFRR